MALAARRGKIPLASLYGAAKEMAKMSVKDLRDFASKGPRARRKKGRR
jgi:hypothetical protein